MRELFESTIERLFADLATPEYVLGCEGGEWPTALWAALDDSGFALAGAPEALGGAQASWNDLYVIARAAGRFVAPVPLGEAILANWLLGRAGIEPRTGSLSFSADASLQLRKSGVSGTARAVPWGRHVDALVAVADADSPSPSLVLLSRASITGHALQLNVAGEPRDDLSFDNAQVLACAPLPAGLPADVLHLGGALLRCAQIAGALHALLAMTSGYASERTQFGRPIGAFQAIQQQLAVFAEQAAAANIAAEAAFAEAGEALAAFSIAAAKVTAAEAASTGAAISHSVHGAIGFTQEYSLHLFTRRLWAWRGEFGSASLWSQRIGQQVCEAGGDGYWALLTGQTLAPHSTLGKTA
ncbi:acyl-CoA dehydrogenase family protein [Pseudomonas typographi]|uniref:Acyl-CoA dehydrogenase n=1 Tax=Pseudomonas typographi TaxID=2715964 RepID=A0ABR7Z9I4_9PSED|nr:acyl-CoA dehydrogenase family protein [Pseudomonas typographi]MBD1555034.1 acyl-CoA dehydrogenase [Pseudomonas typographi]MBD1590070.1 acyl-CoA dehydrogenase [Pseudomonas typographi]MBD1602114.1 acyl-CoA dehydrogenase [Pseudomonas typographi]